MLAILYTLLLKVDSVVRITTLSLYYADNTVEHSEII